MPRIIELKAPDGGRYKICSMYEDDIEHVSPMMWFGAYKFFQLTQLGGYSNDKAKEMSMDMLKAYVSRPCPSFLLDLYTSKSKKQQEKLLRGQSITPEDLICWILQGGKIGGLFSQYAYDAGIPDDLKGRVPILIDASDTQNIKTVGGTDLSPAALLHLVEHQTKIIAQLIDFNDGRWYCFYRTHRGLAGRESGNQGQHVHFISSAYGINRDVLVEGLKNGECPKSGFHVHLSGYWEP